MSGSRESTHQALKCDYCTSPRPGHPAAPQKRFCSTRCRMAWHAARRQAGFALLRQQEQEQQAETQIKETSE